MPLRFKDSQHFQKWLEENGQVSFDRHPEEKTEAEESQGHCFIGLFWAMVVVILGVMLGLFLL